MKTVIWRWKCAACTSYFILLDDCTNPLNAVPGCGAVLTRGWELTWWGLGVPVFSCKVYLHVGGYRVQQLVSTLKSHITSLLRFIRSAKWDMTLSLCLFMSLRLSVCASLSLGRCKIIFLWEFSYSWNFPLTVTESCHPDVQLKELLTFKFSSWGFAGSNSVILKFSQ